MRQGLSEVISLWWVRRRWRIARRRVRDIEKAWQKLGCDAPPWTARYVRSLEVEAYWREQLRRRLH